MKLLEKLAVTYFYTGFCPVSGTVSSFFMIPVILLLLYLNLKISLLILPVITLLVLIISIPLSTRAEKYFQEKDPHEVVIDEVVGMLFTFLFLPAFSFSFISVSIILFAGFILFRFFDIIKVPPIYQLQSLPGGYGIVLDDVLAGIFANIILRLIIIYTGL